MTKRETCNADSRISNGKRHYKFWILVLIILIALWSMFTGSVTLKWSLGNITRFFDDVILEDLDVLEVEEREKVVRHMWDVHTHSHRNSIGLPKFWLEAFQAAYEQLVSDVPAVRDAAVSEIAKMSLRSLNLHVPLPLQSQSHVKKSIRGTRKMKQAKISTDRSDDSNQ